MRSPLGKGRRTRGPVSGRRSASLLTAVVAAALGLGPGGCGGLGGDKNSSEDSVPGGSLELEACGAALAELRCASLDVPLDPTDPEGQAIALKIVVAPATARAPAPDPVFILAGGPGQGAATIAPYIAPKFDAMRRNRDLVFVDLRGTGASAPLNCELGDPTDLAMLLAEELDEKHIDECLASYKLDLAQFSTARQVEDLEAVRAALGYESINFWGISYGTWTGQHYTKRFPERVRSAVYDGVVPTDGDLYAGVSASADRSLRAVFERCRQDPNCDAAFPQLERKLQAVYADLDNPRVLREVEHPRTGAVERVEISRRAFEGTLLTGLYSGHSAAMIPLMIDRAHAGDFGPFAAMAMSAASHDDTISLGLHYTQACSEGYAHLKPEAIEASRTVSPLFTGVGLQNLGEVCARWPAIELAPDTWDPVPADTPALLLSGRLDPITPPELAERLAASMPQARSVVVESAHHGTWRAGCVPELIAEFYDSLDADGLDTSCVDAIEPMPLFLSAAGHRPLPKGHGEQPAPEPKPTPEAGESPESGGSPEHGEVAAP